MKNTISAGLLIAGAALFCSTHAVQCADAVNASPVEKSTTAGSPDPLLRFTAPKTIDLELKGVSVADALGKLKAHFGWEVQSRGDAGAHKVDVSIQNATFFQALESIRAAARVNYEPFYDSKAGAPNQVSVYLSDRRPEESSSAQISGPFLFFCSGKKDPGDSQVFFNVIPEPQLPAVGMEFTDVAISNAAGGAPVPFNPQAGYLMPGYDYLFSRCEASYMAMANTAELPARINYKCHLRFSIPLKMSSQKFDARGATIPGGAFSIDQLKYHGKDKETFWSCLLRLQGTGENIYTGPNFRGFKTAVAKLNTSKIGLAGENQNFINFLQHYWKKGQKPSDIREGQPGVFVLGADGNLIKCYVNRTGAGIDSISMFIGMNFEEEPRGLFVRWIERSIEKQYDLELRDLPVH